MKFIKIIKVSTFKEKFASFTILGLLRVAENSNVCRSAGRLSRMYFIALENPRSNMRSASSSTDGEC